jgi:hypothetical protein
MATFQGTAAFAGNSVATVAAVQVMAAPAVFTGYGRVYAPYAPPPNWWIDTHSAWGGGVIGPSAPLLPPGDDPPIVGGWGIFGGISAPPGFHDGGPAGDPVVFALQAAYEKSLTGPTIF